MQIKGYSSYIKELDGVRGIACILVLCHHYFTALIQPSTGTLEAKFHKIISVFFLSGVDLFFVLSGFLVGGIILDNYEHKNFLKVFVIKRITRIFPIYYLLILSYAIGTIYCADITWFQSSLLKHPFPTWSYLTFCQSYLFGLENNYGALWVAITWSVSVEEQFYFFLPFVFVFFRKRVGVFVILVGLILGPVLRFFLNSKFGYFAAYLTFPARMDSIFMGVLLALILRNEKMRSLFNTYSFIIYSVIVTSFLTIVCNVTTDVVSKFTFLAILYCLILWIILEKKVSWLNKLLCSKWLVYSGSVSYSVYMFHQLINGLVHGFFFQTKPELDSWTQFGATFLSIAFVFFLSHLSLIYIEKPIRELSAKMSYNQ